MEEAMLIWAVGIPATGIIMGGVLIVLMGMYQHTKTLEMRHRERLAMIERGLAPPPERNPEAFHSDLHPQRHAPHSRHTTFGIAVVALGIGLILIIGVAAGAPGIAIGIGGAVVVLGVAFIINGYLQRQHQPPPRGTPSLRSEPPPLGPSDTGR